MVLTGRRNRQRTDRPGRVLAQKVADCGAPYQPVFGTEGAHARERPDDTRETVDTDTALSRKFDDRSRRFGDKIGDPGSRDDSQCLRDHEAANKLERLRTRLEAHPISATMVTESSPSETRTKPCCS